MKKIFYFAFILFAGMISACKKEKKNVITPVDTSKTTVGTKPSTLDLIRDSIYLYAKEDYLWFDQLPDSATFKPRSFTGADDLTALTAELDKLSQYAINPSTNLPYEYYAPQPGSAKYSFIDDGTVSSELNGVKGDFGIDVQYYKYINDLRIEFVYPGSPAGLAGLTRGCRITAIQGVSSINYDGGQFGNGTNLKAVSNAIYNSGNITMTVTLLSGVSKTVSLTTASYNVNPVLKSTVFTANDGHKIGYIVFNSFTSDAVADPVLNTAFSNFTSQNVTDLVVDLRYNGGGYVSTAEYLDNLIVPASKNNTLMYNTFYNSNLVQGKDPLLHKQWRRDPTSGTDYNYGQFDYSVSGNAVNFQKTGSLNVNRVFFIVTGQTASASELTVNNLRPVMNVQIVGDTSYGKPVGFFNININKYEMFTPEFSTLNSANQGGYYSGFAPGSATYPGFHDFDDLSKDFGDPTEGLLADILSYVNVGTYSVKGPVIQSLNSSQGALSMAQARQISRQMRQNKFTGLVFNKKLKLKKTGTK
jgi:C-terminal processing protease CtpA/Prc